MAQESTHDNVSKGTYVPNKIEEEAINFFNSQPYMKNLLSCDPWENVAFVKAMTRMFTLLSPTENNKAGKQFMGIIIDFYKKKRQIPISEEHIRGIFGFTSQTNNNGDKSINDKDCSYLAKRWRLNLGEIAEFGSDHCKAFGVTKLPENSQIRYNLTVNFDDKKMQEECDEKNKEKIEQINGLYIRDQNNTNAYVKNDKTVLLSVNNHDIEDQMANYIKCKKSNSHTYKVYAECAGGNILRRGSSTFATADDKQFHVLFELDDDQLWEVTLNKYFWISSINANKNLLPDDSNFSLWYIMMFSILINEILGHLLLRLVGTRYTIEYIGNEAVPDENGEDLEIAIFDGILKMRCDVNPEEEDITFSLPITVDTSRGIGSRENDLNKVDFPQLSYFYVISVFGFRYAGYDRKPIEWKIPKNCLIVVDTNDFCSQNSGQPIHKSVIEQRKQSVKTSQIAQFLSQFKRKQPIMTEIEKKRVIPYYQQSHFSSIDDAYMHLYHKKLQWKEVKHWNH